MAAAGQRRTGSPEHTPVRHDRLHPGWALPLFFVLEVATIAFLAALAGVLARALHHPLPLSGHGRLTASGLIGMEAVFCVGALVATRVMSALDRRPVWAYGLRAPRRATHFVQGACWGLLAIAVLMGVLRLFHLATVTFSGAGAPALAGAALLWAIAFGLTAAAEELSFRGYPFLRLARRCNPIFAAAVMSLAFGAMHLGNHGESPVGIAMAVAFGLVGCLAVWRTGSLWWVFGLHAAWDWGESFLFGVADSGMAASGHLLTSRPAGLAWLSGGTVGPEGSVIVFPVLALLALVVLWTLPKSGARTLRGPPPATAAGADHHATRG